MIAAQGNCLEIWRAICNPVHVGHGEIKNDDVGLEFLRLCYCVASILGYGNFPSRITLKHEMQEFSRQLVIVDDPYSLPRHMQKAPYFI